MKLNDDLCVKL